MVLDAVSNFVRGNTDAAVGTSDTTVSVADASIFPDPATDGEYNVVIWDANNFPRPDQDGDVEIVRVTARDTGAGELTVVRGQETTTDVPHPEGSAVHLSPTAKMFSDIESEYTAQGENFDGQGTSEFSNLQSVNTEELTKGESATVVSGDDENFEVPDQTETQITLSQTVRDLDTLGIVDFPNDQVVIQRAGVYQITGFVQWRSSSNWSAGDRLTLRPHINGTFAIIDDNSSKIGEGSQVTNQSRVVRSLNVGDTVDWRLFQNSGFAQEIRNRPDRSEFQIVRLG